MIARLWLRMTQIFGHRWTSAYGAEPSNGAGPVWARGLAGLTTQQIGDGVDACARGADPWPPSLPQFRAMCYGVPSFASVESELRDTKAVRTPFTALVWSKLDGYRYRQSPPDQAARQLTIAYELAREHVLAGGALPEAPRGILAAPEPEQRKPADPVVGAEYMAKIAEALGCEV